MGYLLSAVCLAGLGLATGFMPLTVASFFVTVVGLLEVNKAGDDDGQE